MKSLYAVLTAVAVSVLALPVAQAADVALGKALVEKANCAACHGAGLNHPITPAYPKLAGQYADYVYNALRAYQNSNSPVFGRDNPIMKAQVLQSPAVTGKDGKPRPFTSAELHDIAAYVASLPGDLVTNK
ncbi:c-type cytochrome [Pandoraea sp.]|uniref:c-type cytochrome n=1 Tax=Pandoraea sp. TaxID=1883445 RepID=UPI00122972A2|nr:c-type cytochrome [Pandoraea sp.]TAL54843.1 MAG: c-type cytochrome [Pandoraea sp.]TAM18389.1 MAG: c-type cytochrome [Pandoraea sp.]